MSLMNIIFIHGLNTSVISSADHSLGSNMQSEMLPLSDLTLEIELCHHRLHVPPILITRREGPNNLKANMMRHPIDILIRLHRVIGKLATPISRRQVLIDVKMADIVDKERVQPILTNLAQGANEVTILGDGAGGVLVAEAEMRILGSALVVPQVVMLRQVLEGQGLAVFGEGEERLEESHVEVDVVAYLAVVAGWCCGAVG